mgnify:CR=1 FL=1
MSNRLVKNGMGSVKDSGLVLPGDNDTLLEIVVTKAGVRLKSPLPPNEVCKLLNSISIDLMYQSFQLAEVPKIQPV